MADAAEAKRGPPAGAAAGKKKQLSPAAIAAIEVLRAVFAEQLGADVLDSVEVSSIVKCVWGTGDARSVV
jgi:hypothetical protein